MLHVCLCPHQGPIPPHGLQAAPEMYTDLSRSGVAAAVGCAQTYPLTRSATATPSSAKEP
eukprot:3515051-Karenia_brevis.AAC.1